VFVSASDTETQGLVVLEAMANGCPVIARDALGFKDIIRDGRNGLLFNNKNELSEKIILLFKNKKLRNKLIKEGLKTTHKFNSKNYVRKIEKLYSENLESTPDTYGSKIFYGCFLFFNFLLYWFIKNTKISVNSRLINLYLGFMDKVISFSKF
jgi:hypothetical protein